MNDTDYIIDQLLDTPYAKRQNNEYVYVRCPICGDSRKHLDGAHCSIWIKEGQPLIYHCWICESSGIVNSSFLQDLNIDNIDLFNVVSNYNRINEKRGKPSKYVVSSTTKDLLIPEIRVDENTQRKIDYVSKRIGINFTPKSLEYLRVITSLKDFLGLNGIAINPKWKKSFYYLEKSYVGFLTMDKMNIVFRNIEEGSEFRYIKYPIFNGLQFGENSYVIPMKVDVLSSSINLNITEGVFDILSIFLNVMKGDLNNNIYVAVTGSGYRRVIKYFIKKGFIGNLNINIFSDNDKKVSWYDNIFKDNYWFNNVSIYYNGKEGEKDFGVPKERIIVRKAVI